MDTCVFCEIVEGRAFASLVYEDDVAVAFLDIFPVHRGHTLVVPRQHVRDLAECPGELASHLMRVSASLAPRIVRAVAGAGFNVWTANGAAAGQEVFHLHLHILPRFEEDSFGLRFPKDYPRKAARDELKELASRIKTVV